jgi:hypothetical protein
MEFLDPAARDFRSHSQEDAWFLLAPEGNMMLRSSMNCPGRRPVCRLARWQPGKDANQFKSGKYPDSQRTAE